MSEQQELVADPNAPTRNQTMLKRVEKAIRRRGSCDLLMLLDGISLLKDEALIKAEMLKLKKRLET